MSRDSQKVCIAYPFPHTVSARFHHSLMALLVFDAKSKTSRVVHGGSFLANSSGANITNARNEIVRAFLEDLDVDWLLFVDTDMTFEPDIIERMVRSAHPVKRPILGALCFSLQNGAEAAPTIYGFREQDNKVVRLHDYERDALLQVGGTGTGCVLIHRSVFEKFRTSDKFTEAYPWFQETQVGDLPIGEDITFCIRAGALGIPVYVDTSIKCGHEKPFVVDEAQFLAQQAMRAPVAPDVPTYVVCPVENADGRGKEFNEFAASLGVPTENCHFPRNGAVELNLSAKWNLGLDIAEKKAREAGHEAWNVAILNDDIETPPDFLARLAAGLRAHDDIWISYPGFDRIPDGQVEAYENKEYAGQTMAGWAFMVRGESCVRADEQFRWWYGDSDLERQVREAGKYAVAVGGCGAKHLHPMESSKRPELLALARGDELRFAEKWGIDVRTLWLNQHPDFGS